MISFKDAYDMVKPYGMRECIEYENAWWFLPCPSDAPDIDIREGGDLVIYKEDGHFAPFAEAGFDNSMGKEIRTFRL